NRTYDFSYGLCDETLLFNDDTCFIIDVIDETLEEDFDALLDEGSKILHFIEGIILEEKLFAEFDEFIAMTIEENSESESNTKEPPFEKITFNTDYKIKTSLEKTRMDLELKPLPSNLEYVFLEEPSFLPVIISSYLSEENKNKLVLSLKTTNKPLLGKQQTDDNEVDDNFHGETLMEITTKDEPWSTDFANYLVGDVIPKGMTCQQKKIFFSDVKKYFWEDTYHFKVCSDDSGLPPAIVAAPQPSSAEIPTYISIIISSPPHLHHHATHTATLRHHPPTTRSTFISTTINRSCHHHHRPRHHAIIATSHYHPPHPRHHRHDPPTPQPPPSTPTPPSQPPTITTSPPSRPTSSSSPQPTPPSPPPPAVDALQPSRLSRRTTTSSPLIFLSLDGYTYCKN
nr:reverse transcriptase domain-containing protein [Tanacetum cinerariifolium]